jgi:hypothetical protein
MSKTKKAEKYGAIEDAMKKLLKQMQEAEKVVEVSKQDNPLDMITKVESLLADNQYTQAEGLLRHIYRITPSFPARSAIASARRLCKDASESEGKWVKRRALLLRKKAKQKEIQAESIKYAFSAKNTIIDLLATAILEIGETELKNQGDFYSDLIKKQEVVLPPLLDKQPCILTTAPIFFNSIKPFKQTTVSSVLESAHGTVPEMKRLERGFHLYKNAHIVGVPKKMEVEAIAAEVSKLTNKPVSVVDMPFVHKSSKLIWYVYNFPIQVQIIYFADDKIVGETHGDILSKFEDAPKGVSRDRYVYFLEDERRNKLRTVSDKLRNFRDKFNQEHGALISKIKNIEDATAELNEKQRPIMVEFYCLTSLVHSDENPMDKRNGGLLIGQYKRLYQHYKFLYSELARQCKDREERQMLRQNLFNDRMKARNLYWDYQEIVEFKRILSKELKFCRQSLEEMQTMARGGGKSLEKVLEVA